MSATTEGDRGEVDQERLASSWWPTDPLGLILWSQLTLSERLVTARMVVGGVPG